MDNVQSCDSYTKAQVSTSYKYELFRQKPTPDDRETAAGIVSTAYIR
jgi:hypothetical protein